MERVVCNICHRSDGQVFHQCYDLLLDRPEVKSTFVKCAGCGLVYQNPRPTQAELSSHYPPEYESLVNLPRGTSYLRTFGKIFQNISETRTKFILREKRIGRLLDIGCASGAFLLNMGQYPGWELFGVDQNSYAVALARRSGLDVHQGSLVDADYPDNFFDVITLWAVLEHVPDPTATLNEIHRILKPDGLLLLRVPNLSSWDARLFGSMWVGLDAPRHLFVFSPRALTSLLKQTGFKVKRINCISGSYPALVLNVRFWLTARKVSARMREMIINTLNCPLIRVINIPMVALLSLGLRGSVMTLISTPNYSPGAEK